MSESMRMPVSSQVDRLIDLAIDEDLGHGDITTDYLGLSGKRGAGRIIAKEPLVLAGVELIDRIFRRFDPQIETDLLFSDGDRIETPPAVVARVKGRMDALLTGERTVLNFVQRLSGIATHVRRSVDVLPDGSVRLVDTRKTVPGWRVLEKYAVRVGGAFNHRIGLYDGVIVKDNHIAACGGIIPAVEIIRRQVTHLVRIEVEASDIKEVEEALAAGADVIMLDNMDDGQVVAASAMIGRRALIEVSGQVNSERFKRLAEIGVDIVSMGALTHAARFVDISMEISG